MQGKRKNINSFQPLTLFNECVVSEPQYPGHVLRPHVTEHCGKSFKEVSKLSTKRVLISQEN